MVEIDEPERSEESKQRHPFEMAADWVMTGARPDSRCNPGDRWFEFTGTGSSADLGDCTLFAAHCTHSAAPPDCTTWYGGVWTVTTAAGDLIHLSFHGRWLEPGRANQGVDIITVIGGTGRFLGATGEMVGDLFPDWSSLPQLLRLKEHVRGWICY
jgi:hypothetical protein